MLQPLIDFTQGLPTWAQWLGVMLISAIPFVESYFGAAIGVLVGVPPLVAIAAAVLGNAISMLLVVLLGQTVRRRIAARRAARDGAASGGAALEGAALGGAAAAAEPSARRTRLKTMFDRFGVPGVSLLGQTVLPSQITAGAMVSFGASRNAVIVWQCVSIGLWAAAFGVLATLGVNLLALRG